jgi:hypothetical protein
LRHSSFLRSRLLFFPFSKHFVVDKPWQSFPSSCQCSSLLLSCFCPEAICSLLFHSTPPSRSNKRNSPPIGLQQTQRCFHFLSSAVVPFFLFDRLCALFCGARQKHIPVPAKVETFAGAETRFCLKITWDLSIMTFLSFVCTITLFIMDAPAPSTEANLVAGNANEDDAANVDGEEDQGHCRMAFWFPLLQKIEDCSAHQQVQCSLMPH